jgi:sugar transferase EpsL
MNERVYDSVKRVADVFGAIAISLLVLPGLLVVATLIRVSDGNPILYKQIRPGKNGEPFTLYKFRTMRLPPTMAASGTERPQVTRIGLFLRASSLDELPQLWNIVRGEMSFIGPRPLLLEYLPHYTDDQFRRHEVRPGLTGLAQVSGRNALSWEEKFELDVQYIERRSFSLDTLILLKSIGVVISRHGVNAEGNTWVEPFGPTSNR